MTRYFSLKQLPRIFSTFKSSVPWRAPISHALKRFRSEFSASFLIILAFECFVWLWRSPLLVFNWLAYGLTIGVEFHFFLYIKWRDVQVVSLMISDTSTYNSCITTCIALNLKEPKGTAIASITRWHKADKPHARVVSLLPFIGTQ